MNWIWIVLALGVIGGFLYYFSRKKKATPEQATEDFSRYATLVSNLTMEGKEENKDFVVAIISKEEFNRKTPEQINNWIEDKVGEPGILSAYKVTGLGLHELTYTTPDRVLDVFFLIVDKTSQDVIDWKPEPIPEPEPEIPPVVQPDPDNIFKVEFPQDQTDKTREVRELFSGTHSHIHFQNTEIVANGMLTEDAVKYRYGDVGEAGIFRLEGKKNLVIEGKSETERTIFKKTEEIKLPLSFDRTSKLASILSHLKLINCEDIVFKNIDFEGLNNVEGDKGGHAIYDSSRYSEHAFDMEGCKNITFINCTGRFIFGDGYYLRQGDTPNTNIQFINCGTHWNGRQGFGIVHADGVLIDGGSIHSRRSGIDLEPNNDIYTVKNIIIRNCNISCHLLPFPMGGKGLIDGVLIENNTYRSGSQTTYIKHSRHLSGKRKNIIFRGNKRTNTYGSPSFGYLLDRAENVLLENESNHLTAGRPGKLMYLYDCKNIVIKNDTSDNAKWILLKNTPISEVKVIDNTSNLKIKVLLPEHIPQYEEWDEILEIEEYNGELNTPNEPTWEGLNT